MGEVPVRRDVRRRRGCLREGRAAGRLKRRLCLALAWSSAPGHGASGRWGYARTCLPCSSTTTTGGQAGQEKRSSAPSQRHPSSHRGAHRPGAGFGTLVPHTPHTSFPAAAAATSSVVVVLTRRAYPAPGCPPLDAGLPGLRHSRCRCSPGRGRTDAALSQGHRPAGLLPEVCAGAGRLFDATARYGELVLWEESPGRVGLRAFSGLVATARCGHGPIGWCPSMVPTRPGGVPTTRGAGRRSQVARDPASSPRGPRGLASTLQS